MTQCVGAYTLKGNQKKKNPAFAGNGGEGVHTN